MSILITGAGGFIGFHMALKCLNKGFHVLGLDALTPYYDVDLKRRRNAILKRNGNYTFHNINIENKNSLLKAYEAFNPDKVIHFAAQAGVRYSMENPDIFLTSNKF